MRCLALLWTLLTLASPAWAQYTPDQLRALQPVALSVGEATRVAYPAAWRNAHAAGEPQGSEFVRRWALALREQGINACVNGKRGTDTLSQDVLVFPVTEGGNRDTSGRYAQIAIIDVIAGAGGPSPTLGWGDVSAVSPGKCITPVLESGEGGSVPPVVTPPVVTPPPPTVDLAPVLSRLDAIDARLAALEARPAPGPFDAALLSTYIDDMVGNGPGDDPAVIPPHITDVKQRLDVIRVSLEQLTAWLRGRAILRY